MRLLLLFLCLSLLFVACRQEQPASFPAVDTPSAIYHQSISLDTFGGPQDIDILRIPKQLIGQTLTFELAYEDSLLLPTSAFGRRAQAIAAINAGFFNTKRGGSVTYLERADTLFTGPRSDRLHRFQVNPHFNAAMIIDSSGHLVLDSARSPQFYWESGAEAAVLLTGPLLLRDSLALPLLRDKPFVAKAHPRSCLCVTVKDYLLITIDGRRADAHGMNLIDLQQFLRGLACRDALNLDGGGSTTLWYQDSLLNRPSDPGGERAVANALILLEKG